jgi:voltage-gated potassium channel
MHRPLRWGSAKHVPLLLSLLLITAVYPLFRGALLLDLFFSVVLLSMIVSVLERRWLCVAVVVLAVVSLVLRYANYGLHATAVSTLADLSMMVICVITVGGILADVLKDEAVTWDKISGGVCAYLVLGLIWSMAFSMLNRWVPDSFSGPVSGASIGASEDEETQIGTFTYYSFVTLSTLGYGDITPATRAARTLSWLEAVTGQIYLTVLVARLVGLHIAYARQGPRN